MPLSAQSSYNGSSQSPLNQASPYPFASSHLYANISTLNQYSGGSALSDTFSATMGNSNQAHMLGNSANFGKAHMHGSEMDDEYDDYEDDDEYENDDSDDYTDYENDYEDPEAVKRLKGTNKLRAYLTDDEHALLDLIEQSYSVAVGKISTDTKMNNITDVTTTINVTELAVRRLVYLFKMNEDFKSLPSSVNVVLLKGCMMEILLIHGAIAYNRENNSFKEPNTQSAEAFNAASLKSTYGDEIYQNIITITSGLYDLCEQHFLIIKIMLFVVLFTPEREGLAMDEQALVAKLHHKYTHFLYAYMCSLFAWPAAQLKYASFISLLSQINQLGAEFRKIVVDSSQPDMVHGLMREVFSIKGEEEPVSDAKCEPRD
jgi:hypothetical protein